MSSALLVGIRKIEPSLYEELTDTTFGKQTVTGLQLCSMFLPKDAQGYYHVEQELQFGKNDSIITLQIVMLF